MIYKFSRKEKENKMDTFKEYKVADITEEDREQITKLEENISTDKEQDVVLIAYQKE